MSNTLYDNFLIQNKVANMMDTKLALSPYFTNDTSLQQTAGMFKTVNVYTATGAVRDVAMTEGNEAGDNIEVAFTGKDYRVKYVQGRFPYYDEEAMKDPNLVSVGLEKLSANMVNDLNAKFFAELNKAPKVEYLPAAGLGFDVVVDATAQFGETEDGLFILINPAQKATLRKALKSDLQYVEAFVRSGYIGNINNIPIYVTDKVTEGIVYLATKEAVTVFTKKEVETEQERDPNTRKNTIYNRRCNVVALTDESKVVKIMDSTAIASITTLNLSVGDALPTTLEVTMSDGTKTNILVKLTDYNAATKTASAASPVSGTKVKINGVDVAFVLNVTAV